MGLYSLLFQASRQRVQIVQQRLSSCDNGEVSATGFSSFYDLSYPHHRMLRFIPALQNIAPPAVDVAAGRADKIGGAPGVSSFTLYGIKVFHQGKLKSIEFLRIC